MPQNKNRDDKDSTNRKSRMGESGGGTAERERKDDETRSGGDRTQGGRNKQSQGATDERERNEDGTFKSDEEDRRGRGGQSSGGNRGGSTPKR
jgi:hypothetical protein